MWLAAVSDTISTVGRPQWREVAWASCPRNTGGTPVPRLLFTPPDCRNRMTRPRACPRTFSLSESTQTSASPGVPAPSLRWRGLSASGKWAKDCGQFSSPRHSGLRAWLPSASLTFPEFSRRATRRSRAKTSCARLRRIVRLMAEIDEVIAEHGGWPGAFISHSRENGARSVLGSTSPKILRRPATAVAEERWRGLARAWLARRAWALPPWEPERGHPSSAR